MITPYKILGHYKPHKLRGSIIGPRILSIISKFGFVPLDDPAHGPQTTSIWCDPDLHAEVRRFAQPNGQGVGWHQDGDMADGSHMDHAAILWANKTPTQFKWEFNDTIFQPEPYQIVLAWNLNGMHRTPPNAPKPPKRRWFFRQRIEIPTSMEIPKCV
jgi:hypothetical protein